MHGQKNKTLPKSHQQLFNFLNSTMEPWDGPAAIAATDNEWVIAAMIEMDLDLLDMPLQKIKCFLLDLKLE